MLVMDGVVKHYEVGAETIRPLDGVSLTIERGSW